MSEELLTIQQILRAKSSPAATAAHEKFIPGIEKMYGVRMPVINELASKYKNSGMCLTEELWKAGVMEEKMLAAKLLGRMAKKDPEHSIRNFRLFANDIGNWAVCDTLGMQGLKSIIKTHQDEIFELAKKYNQSPDFWQRRLSLVMIEWYTRKKEWHPTIKKLVASLEKDEEYYVKKAVIWINKNFQKEK
ncbi:MAG: DNA alkylation repair protein [Chitinophagaceae bacterium]